MRQRGRRIRRPTAQSGLRSASRRAVPPALCLLALGRLENPVHGTGGLVYGMGCPIGSGMTMRGRRTRIRQFGVRGGENDGCRTRNGRFGVRGGEKDGCRTRIGRFGVRDGLKGWERKTRAANELAARVWVIYIWSGLCPCP